MAPEQDGNTKVYENTFNCIRVPNFPGAWDWIYWYNAGIQQTVEQEGQWGSKTFL